MAHFHTANILLFIKNLNNEGQKRTLLKRKRQSCNFVLGLLGAWAGFRLGTKKAILADGLFLGGCGYGLAGAEHVAIAVIVVRHEQLTGEGLEVKKAGDALGHIVEHAKLIGQVLGKCLLAVPLAAIALTESLHRGGALAGDIHKCLISLALIIIELGKLLNELKHGLTHPALAVERIGVILIIEEHELGIGLITVEPSAGGDEIAVGAEGGQVHPHASQRAAFIVLVISANEHGRIAAAVIVLVEIQIDFLKLINDIEIG